jgi:hypothetical protein
VEGEVLHTICNSYREAVVGNVQRLEALLRDLASPPTKRSSSS